MTEQQDTRIECDDIVELLWPHLDGALPESDRGRVVRHLEGCADCRSHYDYARSFLEAVHEARPDAAADDALRRRVLTALENEGFRGRRRPGTDKRDPS